MEAFCNFSRMTLFLLACGAFLSSPALAFHTSEQDFAPSSAPSFEGGEDFNVSEFYHYLEECRKKVGEECGSMLGNRIFFGKKNEIPASCCRKLVDMGEECHDTMTDAIIASNEFNGNATLCIVRAADTWNMCSN